MHGLIGLGVRESEPKRILEALRRPCHSFRPALNFRQQVMPKPGRAIGNCRIFQQQRLQKVKPDSII
jgi:hypothetical protein